MSAVVDYKIAIGNWVRDRLNRNPAALKVASDDLDLFIVRDFLDAGDCAQLIRIIDAGRIPSQLLPTKREQDDSFRTSESCNLDAHDPFIARIEDKITALMGITASHGETIQGQRYDVGQQFKLHFDFFHANEPYWPEMQRTGGQRTWTAMVFLNTPEAGGHTHFETAGIKLAPRAGNLITWNNLDGNGHPNPFALHEGMPVVAGVKYIITKWYRERPWSPSETQAY